MARGLLEEGQERLAGRGLPSPLPTEGPMWGSRTRAWGRGADCGVRDPPPVLSAHLPALGRSDQSPDGGVQRVKGALGGGGRGGGDQARSLPTCAGASRSTADLLFRVCWAGFAGHVPAENGLSPDGWPVWKVPTR